MRWSTPPELLYKDHPMHRAVHCPQARPPNHLPSPSSQCPAVVLSYPGSSNTCSPLFTDTEVNLPKRIFGLPKIHEIQHPRDTASQIPITSSQIQTTISRIQNSNSTITNGAQTEQVQLDLLLFLFIKDHTISKKLKRKKRIYYQPDVIYDYCI